MSQSFAFPTTLYLVPGALQALSDVSVNPGAPQDGYPLIWNNATAKWEAGSVPRVNGLRFPASQVASSDLNTLDDYEEGVFNPVLIDCNDSVQDLQTTGYSFDESTGIYTKLGNLCNYSGFIGITQKPNRASNRFVLVSIPFLGTTSWFADAQVKPNTVSSYAGTWSIGSLGPLKNISYGALYKSTSFSVGTSGLTLDDIALGSRIIFSLSYLTN
jgi:hypothetical protein